MGKPQTYRLKEIVSRMHALKSNLWGAYRDDEIFKDKPLKTIKDAGGCRFTHFKPAFTVGRLAFDLHSSLLIDPSPKPNSAPNAHFVDRRSMGKAEKALIELIATVNSIRKENAGPPTIPIRSISLRSVVTTRCVCSSLRCRMTAAKTTNWKWTTTTIV